MKSKIYVGIAVILLIIVFARIFYVNSVSEKASYEIIPIGEKAEIGDNFFENSTENMNGYIITVKNAEIISADKYLEQHGKLITDQPYSLLQNYYLVTVNIKNVDNEFVGEKGIDFLRWYIQGSDYILRIEDYAYSLANESLGGSFQFSLNQNKDMDFVLPFYMFSSDHPYNKIENDTSYLVISDYPTKLMLKI